MTGRPDPMFTVVIPTHDRPEMLPQAVASVLAQTVTDLEVVIVDDAGHDAPAFGSDERIRVVRHSANRGPAASRNTGAAVAAGRYLAFLDDDDLWAPHRLELALAGLARAPVAVCWSRYADEVPAPKPMLDGAVGDVVLDHITPMFNAMAIDREAFVPLDERFLGSEDVAWWRDIAQRHDVATVPEFGVVVRRHAGARLLHGDRARIDGSLRLLDEQAAWFVAHPRAAALRWQRVGLTAARAGDGALARDALMRSFRTRASIRPLVHLVRATLVSRGVRAAPHDARPPHDGPSGRGPTAAVHPHGPSTVAGAPLTILQVITDTDRRGAQVFAVDLGAGLEARGHHVTTVALAPGAQPNGLAVEALGPTRRGLSTLFALRRLMGRADVVIAHGSTTLPACAFASIGVATPFVYRQISESLFWAPTAAARWRVAVFLRRATGVVSLATDAGEILVDHFGVARRRLRIVANGVPADAFAPATAAQRASARTRFSLVADDQVVLSISALVPEKGVDRVIDAVAELDGVQLLIGGDGPERPALERRAGERLGDRARFVGALAGPFDAYAAADVLVLASRGGDSMPATLIEAGLCGLASVGTPVGAIADVIDDGETGLIVPVDDHRRLVEAVRSLLDDPDRRAVLGQQARQRCLERFAIDVIAAQWEDALVQAIEVRRRG